MIGRYGWVWFSRRFQSQRRNLKLEIIASRDLKSDIARKFHDNLCRKLRRYHLEFFLRSVHPFNHGLHILLVNHNCSEAVKVRVPRNRYCLRSYNIYGFDDEFFEPRAIFRAKIWLLILGADAILGSRMKSDWKIRKVYVWRVPVHVTKDSDSCGRLLVCETDFQAWVRKGGKETITRAK